MVKTYILAPNWTTAPPPKGPINLGHILDNLTEFVPLNQDNIVPIQRMNPVHTQAGFSSSRGRLISGESGLFAKVLGLVGVGIGAGLYYKHDRSDLLSCERLETVTFDPTEEYIKSSIALYEVERFMKGARYRSPVYMITGLKIVYGGSLSNISTKNKGLRLEGGLNLPASPVTVEAEAGYQSTWTEGESWAGSSPFIVAFRVRKIWFHRGNINHLPHNKKVVMQDGTSMLRDSELILESDDMISTSDVQPQENLCLVTGVEDGEKVHWVVPGMQEHQNDSESKKDTQIE